MLVDHPDAKCDGVLGTVDGDRPAVEEDLARVERGEAVDDVHQRRLPRAVLAQQSVDLAPIDGQVHSIVGSQPSVGLDDPPELES